MKVLAASLVLGVVAWPLAAVAEPVIVVDEDAPFTADELAAAVKLRVTPTRGVRVQRRGETLVVVVGDAMQTVAVGTTSSQDAARVIAMVIVALDGRQPPARCSDPEIPRALVPSAAAAPGFARWSVRGAIARGSDDSHQSETPITAALALALTPHARLVASASATRHPDTGARHGYLQYRLGFEGRAGVLGFEVGGFVAPRADCFGDTFIAHGGYTTARAYLPLASPYRLVLELSGFYGVDEVLGCVMSNRPAGQSRAPGETIHEAHLPRHGGSLGVGIEWQL